MLRFLQSILVEGPENQEAVERAAKELQRLAQKALVNEDYRIVDQSLEVEQVVSDRNKVDENFLQSLLQAIMLTGGEDDEDRRVN